MNKLLQISVFAMLVFPLVSSAVWWNPTTWRKIPTPATVQATIATPVKEIIKEIPKTKIVTQTITVQDPNLQAQIDALVKQVSDLQKENEALRAQNKALMEQTPVISTPAKPVINIVKRDPFINHGHNPIVYSYPITLTNSGDKAITINQIDFQIIAQGNIQTSIGSMYQTSNSMTATLDGGYTNFLLFDSITVNPHQSVTTYINVWGFNSLNNDVANVYVSLKRFVSNDEAQFNF